MARNIQTALQNIILQINSSTQSENADIINKLVEQNKNVMEKLKYKG